MRIAFTFSRQTPPSSSCNVRRGGSPAVNARGEIIGANFDSTVLTQRNAYGYDRNTNRSVIVTTQAVTVALRDVYGMDHLLTELGVSR